MLEAFAYTPSLYIHIPFCFAKCDYCAFYSITDKSIQDAYVNRLISEIKEANSYFGTPYPTAYIGGGNPGCLSPGNLIRLCEAICENGRPDEFTSEMNPESIFSMDLGCFDYLTRLSLGIQSLSEEGLRLLGRNSTLRQTQEGLNRALSLKNKYGFDLNFDLICCRGYEGGSSSEDLEKLMSYDTEHISLYELTLESDTPLARAFRKGYYHRSDDSAEELLQLWEALEKKGYEHYEISSFAKASKRCRHNEIYWSLGSYLGLGSSAASTAIGLSAVRIESPSDAYLYANSNIFENYEKTVLKENEEKEEYALVRLRTKEGISLDEWSKRFGSRPELPKVRDMISDGQRFYSENDQGLLIGDYAALQFCLCNGL